MLVSCVHPVAILRAVFCTICSLSMFVSDSLGDHMVEAYSSTGLVMALYVASMVSLCLPHLVEVRTFSMLIVLRALVAAFNVVVVIDLPLLRVAVEGSDNPVSLEKPCQASLPPDQQGRHSLGRHPEVQYVA